MRWRRGVSRAPARLPDEFAYGFAQSSNIARTKCASAAAVSARLGLSCLCCGAVLLVYADKRGVTCVDMMGLASLR